ncbi:MAG: hypothetical protein JW924_10660 [Fusobacteriaceae bacterium]|nr:hypothetical protein [Fusobacteriaceae bacterium]
MKKIIMILFLSILAILIFIQPGFGMKKTKKVVEIKGKKVLFITKVRGEIALSDQVVIDRLKSLGLVVTPKEVKEITPEDGDKVDLIYISENSDSKPIGNKFLMSKTPLLSCEHYIADDMGFAGPTTYTDYGGTDSIYKEIKIVDSKHPIASGFEGTVTVYKENGKLSWSKPQGQVDIIATLPDNDNALIYAYDKNKKNKDGFKAPARRVFFYLLFGYEQTQTEDSWKLLDAAVKWALGAL